MLLGESCGLDSASSRFAGEEWYKGVKLIKSNKNATGYVGVKPSIDGKKFVAARGRKHIGTFATAQEASFVYAKEKADAEKTKEDAKAAAKEAVKEAAKTAAVAKAAEKNSPLKKAEAKVEKKERELAAAKLDLAAELAKMAVADADDAVPVE